MSVHGYTAYTRGCRCDECRSAKAAYQRDKRQAAKAAGAGDDKAKPYSSRVGLIRNYVPDITHGAAAYQEIGCRCWDCTDAYTRKRLAEEARHRERQRNTA